MGTSIDVDAELRRDGDREEPPDPFASLVLPTLLPRIRRIGAMLERAAHGEPLVVANTETVGTDDKTAASRIGDSVGGGPQDVVENQGARDTAQAQQQPPPPQRVTTTAAAERGTDGGTAWLALGATSEDDAVYAADAFFSAGSTGPGGPGVASSRTPLHADIVAEVQALRDAFSAARDEVDSLDGGELSIADQEALMAELSRHRSALQPLRANGNAATGSRARNGLSMAFPLRHRLRNY